MEKVILLFLLSSVAFSQTFFLNPKDLRRIFNIFPGAYRNYAKGSNPAADATNSNEAKHNSDNFETATKIINVKSIKRNPSSSSEVEESDIKIYPLSSQQIKQYLSSATVKENKNNRRVVADSGCSGKKHDYYNTGENSYVATPASNNNKNVKLTINDEDKPANVFSASSRNKKDNVFQRDEAYGVQDDEDYVDKIKFKKDYGTGVLLAVPEGKGIGRLGDYFKQMQRQGHVFVHHYSPMSSLFSTESNEEDFGAV